MSQHHSFHSSPKHSTFPRLSSSTTHIPRSTTTLTVPSSNSISNQKHFTMGNCLASLCPRVEISKDPATRKVSVKLQQHGDEKSPATAKVLPTPERIGDRTLGDPEERPGSARKTDAANAEDAAVAENGNVTRSGEVERPPVNWREAAARAAEARAEAREQQAGSMGAGLGGRERMTLQQMLQQTRREERRGRESEVRTGV
ncbi:hypothetical protein BU26DRAFT_573748 [Trematosphaeria pertusa]|uniref:Uncharacterized protein n=1 Tax=Trematosphaeria pertusa TaxID=390896 RepID=A0A6A6J0T3_9PLEO|nr:uncharacterized protein BU26DRAFT_573748 [Trematosphaeria pertusa]KAF2255927.1 hypothetical protein BU26DRAFT_573748 [Trematosphaeria pertusa]